MKNTFRKGLGFIIVYVIIFCLIGSDVFAENELELNQNEVEEGYDNVSNDGVMNNQTDTGTIGIN
jgi:hypothetical protein